MPSWTGLEGESPSARPPDEHPWCRRCDDSGAVPGGWGHVDEACRDCPRCAVCRGALAQHQPGVDVVVMVTLGPYGTLRRWEVARECAPEPFGAWAKKAHLWELATGALVRILDNASGMRRGPGARVL